MICIDGANQTLVLFDTSAGIVAVVAVVAAVALVVAVAAGHVCKGYAEIGGSTGSWSRDTL